MSLIACTRMYNVLPGARDAWHHLLEWVNDRLEEPLHITEHPAPAPLEELWRRDHLCGVFMCGWPYARSNPRPTIVAAPVPAGSRYRGRPIYFTDMVVRKDQAFTHVRDTFGGRLAWTAESSHSGFNAPRFHLLAYRSPKTPVLYPNTIGPVVTPMGALKSVLDGHADIAPLDSYALDLIRRHDPALVKEIKVIDSTAAAPIPPLIASPDANPTTVEAVRDALQALREVDQMRDVLEALSLAGFAVPAKSDYRVLEERAAVARRSSYPFPA